MPDATKKVALGQTGLSVPNLRWAQLPWAISM